MNVKVNDTINVIEIVHVNTLDIVHRISFQQSALHDVLLYTLFITMSSAAWFDTLLLVWMQLAD